MVVNYITFEGLSFTGKTTQAHALVTDLQRQGHPVLYRKSCPTPEGITGTLAKRVCSGSLPRPLKEQLFCANILWDNYAIGQTLNSGTSVIQDRGILSYLAFNEVYFHHTPRLLEREVINGNVGLMHPGIVIYLEADPETRMERMRLRSKEKDPSDYEKDEIFGDVGKILAREFENLLAQHQNVLRVDTNNRSIDDIAREIASQI